MRNDRQFTRFMILLGATLGTLGAASGSDSTGPAPLWKAVAASGTVESRAAYATPEAAWEAVARGDQFAPATEVRTGRGGRITLTRNASLLILNPDSQVELTDQPGQALETSVVQTSGSVLYEVDSRTRPHFEVVTPYLVAGVKGTTFLVTVEDSYTAVTVSEGLVEVTTPDTGEVFEVHPGESLFREQGAVEIELVHEHEGAQAQREARLLARLDDRLREQVSATGPDAGSEVPTAENSDATASNSDAPPYVDHDAPVLEPGPDAHDVWEVDPTHDWFGSEVGELGEGAVPELWPDAPVDDHYDDYDDDQPCILSATTTTCTGQGSGSSGNGSGGSGSGSGSSGSGSGTGGSGSGSEPPILTTGITEAPATEAPPAHPDLADPLNQLLEEQAAERREEAEQQEEQIEHRERPVRDRTRRHD